ncbi:MAG TPA: Crp/Fnr family transcriptional regulator [Bauldia sp.]|mgnify:FL=1|nr:Crp/Fnr family transcriptional regulator [Bauldia sp.]
MPGTTFDVDVIAAGEGRVIALADGGRVFSRGDRGACAYIVKAGRIELRADGRAIDEVRPGEIFGQAALIDGATYDATAVAVGGAEVIAIDRPVFNALLDDDGDFALAVMRLTARHLRAAMGMIA